MHRSKRNPPSINIFKYLLFLFSDTLGKKPLYLVLAISLVVIISLFSLAYIHATSDAYLNIVRIFLLVTLATSISLLFIYFACKVYAGRLASYMPCVLLYLYLISPIYLCTVS